MHCLSPLKVLIASIGIVLFAIMTASAQDEGARKAVDDLLGQGKLIEAERLLAGRLEAQPENDEARFALGIVQFLRAVETRMQVFYRHGYRSEPGSLGLRMSNLPIPPNPRPEALDYKTARAVLQGWIDDLARLEASLAKVKSADVKVYLRLG